jgi:hypothetical protein
MRSISRFLLVAILAALSLGCGSTPTTQRDVSGELPTLPRRQGASGTNYELPANNR